MTDSRRPSRYEKEAGVRRRRAGLQAEIAELRERLREAEATLGAIRDGEVDAFVVYQPQGEAIYTLDTEQLVDHLSVITDALPLFIAYIDREQRYRFVNRAYELWFGEDKGELRGRHVRELLGEAGYEKARPHIDEALAGRRSAFEDWFEIAGRRACMNVSYVPHVHRGEVRGYVAMIEDVTERKRAEEALRERETELILAKEVAEAANLAKDRFLATLSHELRTPLTPVLAAVAALDRDARLPEELRRSFAVIRRNVELEARLIDDLLDLTRIARGKLELQRQATDLHQVVAAALETLGLPEAAGGRLTLSMELVDGPALVWADPARLTQVLCNLLGNALKFTQPGGTITVRTRREGESWTVQIADTGMGIAPGQLGTIFSAFDQGRPEIGRQFGGLGLGLAISRAIAEIHGGELFAHSAGPGKGAEFTLRLPSGLPASALETPSYQGGAEEAEGRSLSILLVEDHVDTAQALSELLEMMGHRVEVAGGVAEALAASRSGAGSPRFDLRISDLGLPDGSGLEVGRHLAEQGVPGIVLSGYGMEDDLRRSREAGFLRHLTKPVGPELLDRTIRELTAEPGPGAGGAERDSATPAEL